MHILKIIMIMTSVYCKVTLKLFSIALYNTIDSSFVFGYIKSVFLYSNMIMDKYFAIISFMETYATCKTMTRLFHQRQIIMLDLSFETVIICICNIMIFRKIINVYNWAIRKLLKSGSSIKWNKVLILKYNQWDFISINFNSFQTRYCFCNKIDRT